jgi:hypothetical protein
MSPAIRTKVNCHGNAYWCLSNHTGLRHVQAQGSEGICRCLTFMPGPVLDVIAQIGPLFLQDTLIKEDQPYTVTSKDIFFRLKINQGLALFLFENVNTNKNVLYNSANCLILKSFR